MNPTMAYQSSLASSKTYTGKTFYHDGVLVEERIYDWDETHRKLCWAFCPLDVTVVNDAPNPITHADFLKDDPDGCRQEAARKQVAKHWSRSVVTIDPRTSKETQ